MSIVFNKKYRTILKYIVYKCLQKITVYEKNTNLELEIKNYIT
jgi:hypothetical protein